MRRGLVALKERFLLLLLLSCLQQRQFSNQGGILTIAGAFTLSALVPSIEAVVALSPSSCRFAAVDVAALCPSFPNLLERAATVLCEWSSRTPVELFDFTSR